MYKRQFLTFLKDGVGFVVDLDGPREAEATTVATLDTIAATWQFLPPRLGFGPEPWSTLNDGEFRLRYPAAFTYEEYNTWQRFAADSQTFVAVRVQPAARTPAEAMSGLLGTAAEGVTGFTADEPQRFFYAGRVWEFGGVDYTGRPTQTLGMRGLAYFELSVDTASLDCHSGLGGSLIANAAWRLVWALSTIKGVDERIRIPGFYDKARPATPRDLEYLAGLPDESAAFVETYGVSGFLKRCV